MAIEVESGGGGVFVQSGVSTVQSVSSGTGTLFSLTPPAGERVMLTRLSLRSVGGSLEDVSIAGSLQGNLITGSLAIVCNFTGEFNIGVYFDDPNSATVPYILLEPDETMSVSIANALTETITYQYAFGSIK